MLEESRIKDMSAQTKPLDSVSARERKYLVVLHGGTATCCICKYNFASTKHYNIFRHYKIKHEANCKDWSDEKRFAFVQRFRKQKVSVVNPPATSSTFQDTENRREAVEASYAVSWEICRNKIPFSNACLINTCAIAMAQSFKNDLAVRQFQAVSLSRTTVSERVVGINTNLVNKLHALIQSSAYYSLCLDQSIDIAGISQLAIFIRTVQSNFSVNEDLLTLVPLQTDREVDIFEHLKSVLVQYTDFSKCSSIVTDGAPSTIETGKGLIGFLRENGVHCPALHWIIHQGALHTQGVLCNKSPDLSTALSIVVKIIHLVKGENCSLNHRKLKAFLKQKNAAYDDLLLHADVWWLSASESLERFFAIRKELLEFLKLEVKSDTELYLHLENPDFLRTVAFLTDITSFLNNLNLDLQDRSYTVVDLFGRISGFRRKLLLFSVQFEKDCFVHFPNLQIIQKEYPDMKFSTCHGYISELLNDFDTRLRDFDEINSDILLFANPLQCTVENQPTNLQLELYDLLSDLHFNNAKEKGVEFFKLLPAVKYPNLHMFGLKMLSFFGSTHICGRGFSDMKTIQNSNRDFLNEINLESALRIDLTDIPFNPQELATDAE